MKLEEALKSSKFVDETQKATLNVMYTAYWIKDNISSAIKSTGITIEQFNILRILKGKHPESMCVKDIGSRMIEKNSNVPRIVDRLLAKQLVERSISLKDKRETLINLTSEGLALLSNVSEIVNQVSKDIIGIEPDDAILLHQLLEKMRKA